MPSRTEHDDASPEQDAGTEPNMAPDRWWKLPAYCWHPGGVRPARPRDVQRARVYRAEDVLYGAGSPALVTMQGMRRHVAAILATPFWRERSPVTRVDVHDGRGRRSAAAWKLAREHGAIAMPRWFRTESILLHELAHVMTGCMDHGPRFCAGYLDLVGQRMGREVLRILRASFEAQGVRYVPWVPPRRAAPGVDLQLLLFA